MEGEGRRLNKRLLVNQRGRRGGNPSSVDPSSNSHLVRPNPRLTARKEFEFLHLLSHLATIKMPPYLVECPEAQKKFCLVRADSKQAHLNIPSAAPPPPPSSQHSLCLPPSFLLFRLSFSKTAGGRETFFISPRYISYLGQRQVYQAKVLWA